VKVDKYYVSFENRFTYIEDKAAPAIARLVEREDVNCLSELERGTILAFIAAQIARGKGWRTGLKQVRAALVMHLGGEESAIRAGVGPHNPELDKLSTLRGVPDFIKSAGPHLADKLWMLTKSRLKNAYLIGDDPVVLDNSTPRAAFIGNLGLACEGIEIYLPLSPQLRLALFCPTIERLMNASERAGSAYASLQAKTFLHSLHTGKPYIETPANVKRANALQIAHASRFLISPGDDFQLAEEMIRSNANYSRPPQLVH
jgi:hypothetical protein